MKTVVVGLLVVAMALVATAAITDLPGLLVASILVFCSVDWLCVRVFQRNHRGD